MAFKRRWTPSKTQRREFAIRMQDPQEKAAYEARKETRAENRRAGSKFDYGSAGGQYVPTQVQYDEAMYFLGNVDLTGEQKEACNMVISGYTCQDKVHHDYIHIVNELIRKKSI